MCKLVVLHASNSDIVRISYLKKSGTKMKYPTVLAAGYLKTAAHRAKPPLSTCGEGKDEVWGEEKVEAELRGIIPTVIKNIDNGQAKYHN